MSGFSAIVTDTQTKAKAGDLAAAKARIADFETLWDDSEAKLRPLDGALWGKMDDAADVALHALRATPVDAAAVDASLTGLQAALAATAGDAGTGGVQTVAGIAVSDASGHPISCEVLLTTLSDSLQPTPPAADLLAKITDLQAKALERCNADDDKNADQFSAEALALVKG